MGDRVFHFAPQFLLFAVRDVLYDIDQIIRVAIRPADGRYSPPHPYCPAALAREAGFDDRRAGEILHPFPGTRTGLPFMRDGEFSNAATDQFLLGITEHAQEFLIGVGHNPVQIDRCNADGRIVEQDAKPLLIGLAFRNVDNRTDQSGDAAVPVCISGLVIDGFPGLALPVGDGRFVYLWTLTPPQVLIQRVEPVGNFRLMRIQIMHSLADK